MVHHRFSNRRSRHWLRPVILVAFLALASLLTACDDGLVELAAEMALEWAESKSLISVDEAGKASPNLVQIGLYEGSRAWNKVTGGEYTTGDTQLDAALDIAPIGLSIRQADKLAEEGMQTRNPAKLDEAIGKRPGDWNYYDQKAAILYANGDKAAGDEAAKNAQALVNDRVSDGGNCQSLTMNMLRGRIQAIEQQLAQEPQNPLLLDQLGKTQAEMFAVQNNTADSPCSG